MDQSTLQTFLWSLQTAQTAAVRVHVEQAKERTLRGAPTPPLPPLDHSGSRVLSQSQFTRDLAPIVRPRRAPKPIDRLIQYCEGERDQEK